MAGEDDIETTPPNNHTDCQVCLPTFWAQAPVMWFAQAECLFELQGVTCQVVASLTHEFMRRVSDPVEQRPDQDPYELMKARLLTALQLTDYQRADKLFELPGLGARKPSELMSQMLEICPRGEERSHLFTCLFLRRSGSCSPRWTTRTRRSSPSRQTSCGPCTPTTAWWQPCIWWPGRPLHSGRLIITGVQVPLC
jgi:hypothetical protein